MYYWKDRRQENEQWQWTTLTKRGSYSLQTRREAGGGHRLTVRVHRRPSGTLATIMPMRKMIASSQYVPRNSDIMENVTPRQMANIVMTRMKFLISRPIGVSSCRSPDARKAMRPMSVSSPTRTTIPTASPTTTPPTVHSAEPSASTPLEHW